MADKDDFSFDKDSNSSPPVAPTAAPPQKAQRPPSRALLLGLLLVVLGGAAYFYSLELMTPEEIPVPAGVTKQRIIPPPAAAPAPETAPGDKPLPTAAETVGQGSAPASDAAKAALPSTAAASGAPLPAPGADGEIQAAPAVVSKPLRGSFTLLAGAYISPAMLQSATSKVRSLGYQPRTLRDAKLVEMTRVRIGGFAPAEAQAKLAELKKIAPDAFTLPEGEQVAVYAASHFDQKAHAAFAEKLRQAGVAFEEEKAMRKLPMTELFFGEFNDRAEADRAAVKARKAGLEIVVFKRP